MQPEDVENGGRLIDKLAVSSRLTDGGSFLRYARGNDPRKGGDRQFRLKEKPKML